MKLYVIFAQRKCSYEGQYAPEALEIADENTMSDNPTWLPKKLDSYRNLGEFLAVETIVVDVPYEPIRKALSECVVVPGKIVKDDEL